VRVSKGGGRASACVYAPARDGREGAKRGNLHLSCGWGVGCAGGGVPLGIRRCPGGGRSLGGESTILSLTIQNLEPASRRNTGFANPY